MKRHRILALVTALAAMPVLWLASLLLLVQAFPLTHGLVLEKLLLGSAAIIAGVLLWRGHRLMYWLGLLSWLLFIVWATNSLYLLHSGPSFAGQMPPYVMYISYIILGISMSGVLCYNEWRVRDAP
jgi:hypothetical protein